MAPPTKIAHLFDKHGSICRPVIFWRDRIYGLSIEVPDTPHTVGGPLPECEGIGARVAGRAARGELGVVVLPDRHHEAGARRPRIGEDGRVTTTEEVLRVISE